MLDRELDVAQVSVVRFELPHVAAQPGERDRVERGQLLQRYGVADTGDDVLALGIGKVVAVQAGAPGGRVARERDSAAGIGAEVPEDHALDVDRCPETVRNVLAATVEACAVTVPRREDGEDRLPQLLGRVLRKRTTRTFEDEVLEHFDDPHEVADVQVGVVYDTVLVLDPAEDVFEERAVDAHDRTPEHLHEATVGIPREPLPVGDLGQAEHREVVQTDVQDGLHHARHGEPRPRPDREEQRVVHLSQPLAGSPLELRQVLGDLALQARGQLTCSQENAAGLRRDGEARRHGQAHAGHLREVRALASEQIGHVPAALGEVVHVGTHDCHQPPRRYRAHLSHWLVPHRFREGPDGPSWGRTGPLPVPWPSARPPAEGPFDSAKGRWVPARPLPVSGTVGASAEMRLRA